LSVFHNFGNQIAVLNWKWIPIFVTVLSVPVDHEHRVSNCTLQIESPSMPALGVDGTQNNPRPIVTCCTILPLCACYIHSDVSVVYFRRWGLVLNYQFAVEEASFKHISWPSRTNGCLLLIISVSDYTSLHAVPIVSSDNIT
jgi:hypothetical protein